MESIKWETGLISGEQELFHASGMLPSEAYGK